MFKLNLILRRKSDDELIFSPAPWFRIIFLFFAASLVTGILTIGKEDSGGNFIVPVLITAACVIAALYTESWLFDRDKRIIIHKSGLLFLNKKMTLPFAEIDNLEISSFLRGVKADSKGEHELKLSNPFSRENTEEVKGGPRIIHPKYHQDLCLKMKNGDRHIIESIDSRKSEALKKKAGIISDFSGISLIQ